MSMNRKRRSRRNRDHDSIDNDTESNDSYQEQPEPSEYLSMTDDDEDYDCDDDDYDDDEAESDRTGPFVTDVERFRRWFICPVVGCNHMGEHDARESGDWYCASDFHPTARMKILFNDRLM